MRESNIEILRILSMFMIILWHINIAVEHCEPYTHDFVIKDFIYSITVVAVNCFVLISGYFGIHFKYRNIILLLLQCIFYSIFIEIIIHCISDHPIKIWQLLMPVSNNVWWFLTTYFMLYISAPLLNKAIDNMEIREILYTLLAFTIICVYFGYIFKNGNNSSGHSYLQFIYMYIIGRMIHRATKRKKNMNKNALNILIGGGGLVFIYCITTAINAIVLKSYRYNNPLVIISACCLLLIFLKFKFTSTVINKISATMLAVYLIHEHPIIRPLLAEYVQNIHREYSLCIETTLYILIAISVIILAFITEQIRKITFIPINYILNKYIQ